MFQRKVKIDRIKKESKIEETDIILIEQSIDIIINSHPLVSIICLPKDLEDLAIGFLFSIGIINSFEDIKSIDINELDGKINIELLDSNKFKPDDSELNPISRVIDTTCGVPSPWRNILKKSLEETEKIENSKKDIKIKSSVIFNSIIKMQQETKLFKETGGCHGSAIFDLDGNLIVVREDIGRHNAIDKVIGNLLLRKESLNNKFLTSTGRLTGDSVLKAIRATIPVVASLSAAIESGVRLAFAYGITLIGFVRGSRMNIYTHPDRIEI